jgi:DnaJ-class molecular chaperone
MQEATKKPRRGTPEHHKQRCNRCRGSGQAPCPICNGRGEVMRGTDPRGLPLFTKCNGCYGRKTVRCAACAGEGFR